MADLKLTDVKMTDQVVQKNGRDEIGRPKMADPMLAAVSAFRKVYGDVINVAGWWFHYAQAVVKRVKKTRCDVVTETVQCLLGLSLLPGNEIAQEDCSVIKGNSPRATKLQELVA